METNIPGAAEVREALAPLTLRQLDRLAELSGVPATTIYKIKRGETENPGIETLRKFLPHVAEAQAEAGA
ncbi:helix-turn-helix domain-containing protein [Methylibium petroleiphilum]